MSGDPKAPWYGDGLRFECRGCGTCCRGEGYVWVDRTAARRLAKHLGLSVEEFGRRYLRRVGRRNSLTEKANHDCIFWSSKRPAGDIGDIADIRGHCEVYEARPPQCRTFPFWNENLSTERSWKKAAETCRGMDSGRLYEIGEILELSSSRGETHVPTTPSGAEEGCGCGGNQEPD